jgi:GntR family transcriptional repressor for pyruvate dehydrogenase complex
MEREASRFYSLSDFAYEKILANIIGGAFQQGERLPAEDAMAVRLGVSRPIVREALARLREEGLIISRRGSGSYVVGQPARAVEAFSPLSSITDMQQCFEFRLEIEGIAAYHAAQRRTDEDMASIETVLNVWNELRDRGIAGIQEDFDFHASICRASHNRFFIESLDFLKENICTGMNLSRNLSLQRPTERTKAVQDEHAAIAAAVRAQDGSGAQEAMRRHIATARTRVFQGVGHSGDVPVL